MQFSRERMGDMEQRVQRFEPVEDDGDMDMIEGGLVQQEMGDILHHHQHV